ncbi:unnamed protein product [Notodromas monacha]|uniref:Cytochrome b-c1 complex subunit 10 n=1 Tax=Notodromas monacha TaxID=399045 RepID=A0A7R9GAU4_9CRUS|nr:unnamed protein product [Notodromas monacha]CAG0915824.1 unnamed protein product [Notodromas monacha]
MAGLTRFLGGRYRELAQTWVTPAATFGAAAGIAVTWGFDWKAVLQYVPIVNLKWKDETS